MRSNNDSRTVVVAILGSRYVTVDLDPEVDVLAVVNEEGTLIWWSWEVRAIFAIRNCETFVRSKLSIQLLRMIPVCKHPVMVL